MDQDELSEQIDYYKARAAEYDDWWERRGRYDRGPEYRALWDADVETVEQRLVDFAPTGRVAELAAGTGNWTRRLAAHADQVVAVDASPETLAINRAKLEELGLDDRVDYVEADLFAWQPDDRFDVVAFCFWLSHVPDDRFEAFWRTVDRALAPGGRVWLLDNAHPELAAGTPGSPLDVHYEPAGVTSEAGEHPTVTTAQGPIDLSDGTAVRTLADGRRFTIVKRFHRPDQLSARLAELGWRAQLHTTDRFFLYGSIRRA